MPLLFHKGLKLVPFYALPLFCFKYPGIPRLSWILELLGGGERNFMKFLVWSRSPLKSEGVPLNPLIGYPHGLSDHWHLRQSTASSFPSPWVACPDNIFICSRSLHYSVHSLISGAIASLMYADNLLHVFEPSLWWAPGWCWGYNGVQTWLGSLPSGNIYYNEENRS